MTLKNFKDLLTVAVTTDDEKMMNVVAKVTIPMTSIESRNLQAMTEKAGDGKQTVIIASASKRHGLGVVAGNTLGKLAVAVEETNRKVPVGIGNPRVIEDATKLTVA